MTRAGSLALSGLAHALILGVFSLAWFFVVDSVPEPPITIRFVPGPPVAAIVQPARPREPLPVILPDQALPVPRSTPPSPAAPAADRPAGHISVAEPAGAETAPPSPPTAPVVENVAPPAVARPAVARRDSFEPPVSIPRFLPAGSRRALTAGVVESFPTRMAGTDAGTPAADILKHVASGGTSDAITNTTSARDDLAAGLPGRIPPVPATGGRGAEVRPASSGTRGEVPDRPDANAHGQATASLGSRYSLQLVDARELGHSTHDGWRYSQLLPLLAEAYHNVAPLGSAAGGGKPDDDVESVRVDPDAVAITYRDGTRHIVAPTRDGLVALYVSAGPSERSKVHEMERALAALRRLMHTAVHS
jgi:hypothetical protein